nr:MATE family efflux transporter [bacterium]
LVKGVIMGHMGKVAVSANAMTDVVLQLATMFIFGLASAACVMIGKTVGEQDYARTRAYSRTLQALFFLLGIAAALLTYFIRPLAVSFYDVEQGTRDMAMRFMTMGAVTIWGTAYAASCFTGINRGAGDAAFVVKTDLFFGWIIVIPLMALAGFVWKLDPMWVFFFSRIDQIGKVFFAYFRLRGNKWIRNVTRD